MIVVDIEVWNGEISAFKPEIQTMMPNDDVGITLFCNNANPDRLNKRIYGELIGKSLKKAKRIVDKYGEINTSGVCGSVQVDEKDFIPYD